MIFFRQREEEIKREEDAKIKRKEALAASLPPEPLADDTENNVIIRFRFPNNEQKMRRFKKTELLKWVVVFVESLGFSLSQYRILNSDVPKKDVGVFNSIIRIPIESISDYGNGIRQFVCGSSMASSRANCRRRNLNNCLMGLTMYNLTHLIFICFCSSKKRDCGRK